MQRLLDSNETRSMRGAVTSTGHEPLSECRLDGYLVDVARRVAPTECLRAAVAQHLAPLEVPDGRTPCITVDRRSIEGRSPIS